MCTKSNFEKNIPDTNFNFNVQAVSGEAYSSSSLNPQLLCYMCIIIQPREITHTTMKAQHKKNQSQFNEVITIQFYIYLVFSGIPDVFRLETTISRQRHA